MSEYIPTTEDVRLVYMANCNRHCSVDHQAEFDRWLQSIQAEAWDEGANAERDYWYGDITRAELRNPYEEETE